MVRWRNPDLQSNCMRQKAATSRGETRWGEAERRLGDLSGKSEEGGAEGISRTKAKGENREGP